MELKTGRDVLIAALLGAEEYGFSTAPLIGLGCIMMRKCHLNTCPVGIATQDPELRAKFRGEPEHVVNYLFMVAEHARRIMAQLGFASIEEMIGRVEVLEPDDAIDHWKAQGLDIRPMLAPAEPPRTSDVAVYCVMAQDHGHREGARQPYLIELARPAIEDGTRVRGDDSDPQYQPHRRHDALARDQPRRDRSTTPLLGRHDSPAFPGDRRDRVSELWLARWRDHASSKGMRTTPSARASAAVASSCTPIARRPSKPARTSSSATSPSTAPPAASVYLRGRAGERFCGSEFSGARAVVEGVGDHACEYMTGGRVVVLGGTGRNFGAGMSGGIAYVWDVDGSFPQLCNLDMVSLGKVMDTEERHEIHQMIQNHLDLTGSEVAKRVLETWNFAIQQFVRVMPDEYARVLAAREAAERAEEEAARLAGKEIA